MNITPEMVARCKRTMAEYDSAQDVEARISAGKRLDDSVDGLSEKQIPLLVKMALK